MYLTIRRYEGVDVARTDEIVARVDDSLLPSLRSLPGFAGYTLIDCGEGVLTSVGLFEEPEQAHESTRVAARWIREQDLISAIPNTPVVTAGDVLVHASGEVPVPRETTVQAV
jgi:hypothetical protein